MGKIKKLAGETVIYGLGTIIPRFINFLLVRLHTDEDVFTPDEYGIITKVFAYTAVINTILLFGMETAYFRFATKEGANEKKIFNLAQTIVIGISLALCLALILFNQSIAQSINLPGKGEYVIYLAIIMFIDAVVAIPFARLRLYKKALRFASGKLINIALLVGLNIYFLLFAFNPEIGVAYVFIANLIANAFYLVFFAPTLIQWRPAFEKTISPAMLSYGYPIMITGLAGMTNEMFSRLTLEAWLPDNFYPGRSADYALGVFGACYKLAMLMSLAVTAFRYAAEPFFFSHASDKQSPDLFARVNHYFVIVCCFLLLSVGVNLDIFKYFLGDPKYWEGLHIVPILLLAYLFLGVYYNFSVWFKLTDKTYWGTIITILGALITIIANYILIPLYGYEGSSLATLICYFVMAGICYLVGQRFFPIPYKIGVSFLYILLTTVIVYGVNSIPILNTWLASSFHLFIIAFFMVIVFFVERKEFRQSLN
jgi:O-antigen/teichoic acid export membrane protein